MNEETKQGLAALAVLIGASLYILMCSGAASAAEHELRFQNPGTTAYASIRTAWGTVAAPCAPGATCSAVVDIPFGRHTVSIEASDGTRWSAPSNMVSRLVFPTPVECLAIPACRFDSDRDGSVNGGDFGAFIGAFNSTWIP